MVENPRPSPDNEHQEKHRLGIKRKHMARIFAAGEIGIGFWFLTRAVYTADPSELPLIISELFARITAGGGSVLFMTDGVVDFAKGTHHYFPLKVWQSLTKNEKTKAEIDDDIKRFLETREEKIHFF